MWKTIAVIVAAATLACAPQPTVSAAQPALQPDALRVITFWMECEECTAAQLQAVVRLGPPAVPALNEFLRNGPPSTSIDPREKAIRDRYQQQQRYAPAHPESRPPMSEDDTVALYLRNYRAAYRSRAAQALRAIGTAEARAALTQALTDAAALRLTPAEVAAIRRALQ